MRTSHPETSLAAAQTLLARQYGLRTWPDLKAEVERRRARLAQPSSASRALGETREELEMPTEERRESGTAEDRVPVRLQRGPAVDVSHGEGSHVGSMTAMVVKTLRDQPVLRVRRPVREEDCNPGRDLNAVLGVLLAEGLLQAGPPYFSHPEADREGVAWTEAGIPVHRAGVGEG